MKKRTNVHLGKGMPSRVDFHVLGVVSEQFIRIANLRDWSVFHFPGLRSPVIRVWDAAGQEMLYAVHLVRDFPTHEQVVGQIEEWMHAKWETRPHAYSGVAIPLVTHDRFVVVPEQVEIEKQPGNVLIVEPPCLLWHECHPQGEKGSVCTSIILIRSR